MPSKKFLVIVLLHFFLFPALGNTASYDPSLKWRTIQTQHFRIHHADRLASTAQKAAAIFEDVHGKLSSELRWKPWLHTEVVLLDNTDDANGFATVIPYNWIALYVVPPRADSSLGNYDDWLRVLITHEYTHILHMDAARGLWRVLRVPFGKIVAPAGLSPVWIREGFATYEETKHTDGGRGRSTYTDMLLRTAVVEHRFPGIDQADGFSWEWPSFQVAYLFGERFIEYLVETYGEEKFLEFTRQTQKSMALAFFNHHAKKVYGKSFYELWNEWHVSLKAAFCTRGEKYEPLFPVKRYERYSVPTLSPDGKFVAFNVETPEGPSRIQIYDMETKKRRTIVKYQSASQFAWLPDSSAIIYSTLSGYKRYSRYFDLWRYDLNTKKALRLTSGERARDPAVHPDGKRVLFVAGGPEGDELKVLDLETKSITSFGDSQEKGIQFFRPQWSPDGKRVVVSRHTPDEKWKLYLYTLRDRGGISARGLVLETSPRSLQSNGVHELDPIWFADNKSVFYSSDQSGISNLHRVNVKTGKTEQLTNVASGLFHPTTADGDTFIAQHYTAKGFELVRFQVTARGLYSTRRLGGGADLERSEKSGEGFPLPRLSSRSDTDLAQNEASIEHTPYKSSKYVAFGKSLFLPRYIAPNVFYTGETVLMSATTGAADPLRWHSWLGGASYRLDAKHLGYFGSYVYTRFRPTFGLGVNDFVVNYGNLTFDGDGDLTTANDRRTVHYFEERRGGYAYVSMPFSKHSVSASFFAEDHSPKPELTAAEEAALNTGIFSGVRVGYGYGDYEQYPASISREDGRRIQLFASMSDSVFGSGENNEQVILSGEWREYVNLWKRHVLALRAMGGTTLGDRVIQGTFSMGGALGEGAFAGGGSLFYLPLRGLPVASFSRTRAMLLSSEYRIPLTSPERGLGTTPFFLKNIHAGFFADYGNAWNAGEGGSDDVKTFFDDFFLGVGAELRGDFVVGYGLPITGRLGYGIIVLNRDRLGRLIDDVTGTSAKNGTVILQLGTSF